MDWLATLRRSGGLHALSRQLDAPPADVISAADRLLPVLISTMRAFVVRNGEGEAGVRTLIDLLSGLGDGDLAAQVMGQEPLCLDRGEKLLSALLPPEAQPQDLLRGSGTLTQDAALVKRLLPALAMLVGGYIGAKASGSAGAAERVADMLELAGSRRPGGAGSWNSRD